jgi:uncharacterized membrane protein
MINAFNKFRENFMLPKIDPVIACVIAVVGGILLNSVIGMWAIIPTFYLIMWYFECTEK